jgi:hypothetical protein
MKIIHSKFTKVLTHYLFNQFKFVFIEIEIECSKTDIIKIFSYIYEINKQE